MSSIPLPALSIHPQQAPDPTEGLQRILMMRNLLNQGQLQQQQIQGAGLENQLRANQIKAQQTLQQLAPQFTKRDENGKPTGYDYDGFKSAAQNAGLPLNMVDQITTAQKNSADAVLASTNADKAKLDNQQKLNDQGFQRIEGIRGEQDPAQRQTKWQAASDWWKQNGGDASKLPPQAPDDAGLSGIEAMLGMHAQALADVKARAEAGEAQSKEKTAAAEATIKGAEAQSVVAGNPVNPQFAEAKYTDILRRLKNNLPVSDQERQWAQAHELSKRETNTQSDTLGVTTSSTKGPSGLAAVTRAGNGPAAAGAPPTAQQAKESDVDLIGQYKMSPQIMSRLIAKHGDIPGLVHLKYPDWDQTTYEAKNKLIQSYTSGPNSKEINAINTAMGHMKVLDDAVGALNNGDVQVINKIANAVGAQIGETPKTTFQTILHRVGPEITAAYIPGAGGEAERFANEKDFSPNLSPDQLHSNIGTSVKLLRSKVGALENQYKNTVGRDDFQQRFITPEAQAAFQKFAQPSGGGAAQHVIQIGPKQYRYKGSGATNDLANYTEIQKP